MIPKAPTFYKVIIYLNNGYRLVTYHLGTYYIVLSDATTMAKEKYPHLTPSGWKINKITKAEYESKK